MFLTECNRGGRRLFCLVFRNSVVCVRCLTIEVKQVLLATEPAKVAIKLGMQKARALLRPSR